MKNNNTSTIHEKNSTHKQLTPAITQKAQELFDLIEQECEAGHRDHTFENMVEEMGEMLQNHDGFSELLWAYRGSEPKSKQAKWSIEESATYMNDDTLADFYKLAKNANKAVEYYEEGRMDALNFKIKELKQIAPEIFDLISSEYCYRSKEYSQEIEELKQTS